MQDAINTICGIMNVFPDIHKISIVDPTYIGVHWSDIEFHKNVS